MTEMRIEPFGDQVLAWHAQGVEGQAIWQLLVEQHGFGGSYSSLKRFLRRVAPPTPRATLRLEVDPGEEAQVDFGFGGLFRDPERDRRRRAWAFVMTLSCSRHQYAELVFDQSVATWLRLHRAAFEFFGGVPRRVVLDNLRAAIVHAALYDPEVQRSYREFAEAYGFLIAPCRPRTPQHKGKVEQGGVHYVKRNALAGRDFRDLPDGNRHLLRWVVETAGRRVHGTIKQIPLEVFDHVERAALQPLPVTPWELTEWKRAKLHPDCHVVFAGAYYSGPHRLIGQRLWVRATDLKVELYQDYILVATHRRARPASGAPHRPLAARQGPLPHANADVVSHARGGDRPRLWRLHRAFARRSPSGSAPQRPRHPAPGPPLHPHSVGRRLCPGPRRRRVSLPHREDDPRAGP